MSSNKAKQRDRADEPAAAVDFYQMFIDGEWVGARGGASLAIVDPATEELVAHAASGGVAEAQAAVAAARRAFDEGPWPRLSAHERAEYLRIAGPSALATLAEGIGVSLTVSIGIATRWPSRGEDIEAVLHRADQAMYEVKRNGRGHWRVAHPEGA